MSEGQPFQFDRAEYASPPERVCASCRRPLQSEYFEYYGKMICDACAFEIRSAMGSRNPSAGMMRAAVAGVAAAAAGAAIYAVVRLSGYDFSLIAILVGYIVGRAVRWGSEGRGGRRFQALAIILTYISITASAIPHIWRAASQQGVALTLQSAALVFWISLWLPFAAGWKNLLGIAILAIGLYEAWRVNRGVKVEVTGPYSLKSEEAGAS